MFRFFSGIGLGIVRSKRGKSGALSRKKYELGTARVGGGAGGAIKKKDEEGGPEKTGRSRRFRFTKKREGIRNLMIIHSLWAG